jgi:enamine deaminase RidA (YjgF/YER057c/UK114 family)
MTPEERLAEAGLTVPSAAVAVASYVPAVRTDSWVFTSGQVPLRDGQLLLMGKVGDSVTVDEARTCAQQAALNALAAVKMEVGDLSAVRRVVKAVVFVASTPEFTAQPQVANAASDVFTAAFGEAGQHARSAVGVAVLPLNAPVEVELIVEIAP